MAVFIWCIFLFLLTSNTLAVPVLPIILPSNQPNLAPLNEILYGNTSDAATSFGLSSLQDEDVIDYLVPNTPTIVRFYLQSTTIEQQDMARTFLQTQIEIRRYITTHYQAANDVLFHSDDPYMSKPEFTGCFFAVGHYPLEDRSRLTYGMVDNVLKGMWEFLYRGGRFVVAEFYVVDEHLGTVGIGLVEKNRPRPNPGNATEG